MFSGRKEDGRTCASDPFDEACSGTRSRDREEPHPAFGSHVIHVKLFYAILCERQRTSMTQPEVVIECDCNSPFMRDDWDDYE